MIWRAERRQRGGTRGEAQLLRSGYHFRPLCTLRVTPTMGPATSTTSVTGGPIDARSRRLASRLSRFLPRQNSQRLDQLADCLVAGLGGRVASLVGRDEYGEVACRRDPDGSVPTGVTAAVRERTTAGPQAFGHDPASRIVATLRGRVQGPERGWFQQLGLSLRTTKMKRSELGPVGYRAMDCAGRPQRWCVVLLRRLDVLSGEVMTPGLVELARLAR